MCVGSSTHLVGPVAGKGTEMLEITEKIEPATIDQNFERFCRCVGIVTVTSRRENDRSFLTLSADRELQNPETEPFFLVIWGHGSQIDACIINEKDEVYALSCSDDRNGEILIDQQAWSFTVRNPQPSINLSRLVVVKEAVRRYTAGLVRTLAEHIDSELGDIREEDIPF